MSHFRLEPALSLINAKRPRNGRATAQIQTWISSHVGFTVATLLGVGTYLIGYGFLDGYLSAYGFSVTAMPHDYTGVMMKAFSLLFYAYDSGVKNLPAMIRGALAVGLGLFVYVWLIYAGVSLVLKGVAPLRRLEASVAPMLSIARPFVFKLTRRTDATLLADRPKFVGLPGSLALVFGPLFLLCSAFVIGLVVLPVLIAALFGSSIGRDEIEKFQACAGPSRKQPCLTVKISDFRTIAGSVVAGTENQLLIFDEATAHLLKRTDALRVAVPVRK